MKAVNIEVYIGKDDWIEMTTYAMKMFSSVAHITSISLSASDNMLRIEGFFKEDE